MPKQAMRQERDKLAHLTNCIVEESQHRGPYTTSISSNLVRGTTKGISSVASDHGICLVSSASDEQSHRRASPLALIYTVGQQNSIRMRFVFMSRSAFNLSSQVMLSVG